jgi:hypothetical protein
MFKKPRGHMDDEQIIKRRDGVTVATSGEQLDPNARRALADARLRALAFALSAEQGPRDGEAKTDDADLLAYLLDVLPQDRRMQFEVALRGDAAAFARLITLRAAFNSQADKRDQDRADHPSRKIRRRTVGRLDIRSVDEELQFRDARVLRPQAPDVQQFAHPLRSGRRTVAKVQAFARLQSQEIRRPRLRLRPKTEIMLSNVLDRVRRDFDAGLKLVNTAQSLVAKWEESDRRGLFERTERGVMSLENRLRGLARELHRIGARVTEGIGEIELVIDDEPPLPASVSLEAERFEDTVLDRVRRDFDAGLNIVNEVQPLVARWEEFDRRSRFKGKERDGPLLEERLTELLCELQRLGAGIKANIRELAIDAGPPRASYAMAASQVVADSQLPPLPADHGMWVDTFTIEAGPWLLHLTGSAMPTPQLAVTLLGDRDRVSREEPFLTLVRPAQGFEIVNLDSSGNGKIALPPRESVLLVQSDEVWDVRLNFHNS